MATAALCFARTACLLLGGLAGGALPLAAAPARTPPASTDGDERDPEALAALDRMGAALRALKQFSLTSDASTEVVLEDGQKIELDGVVTYKVKAPNQLFLELRSDRQLRQLFYDGNALTVYSPRLNYYAQVDGVGATLGELVDRAADRYGIEMPLADMFLWGTDKAPKTAIRAALHVGGGTLDGEPIEQYAFKQDAVDWQVWISKATAGVGYPYAGTRDRLPVRTAGRRRADQTGAGRGRRGGSRCRPGELTCLSSPRPDAPC